MWYSQENKTVYQGDKARWQDIKLTTNRPSPFHSPVIEEGVHTGKWVLDTPKFLKAKEAELDADIQARLDAFAQTRLYANMDSLCTYVTSTNTQFAAEAARGVQLRDDTWIAAGMILNEVKGGSRPVPETLADIEDELPELTWGDV